MKNIKQFRKTHQYGLDNRVDSAKRRSLKLGIKGSFTRKTIENLFLKQRGRCACCGKLLQEGWEVDHITPLSRGGKNSPSNLQLLTKNCNRRKSNKTMSDYLGGK